MAHFNGDANYESDTIEEVMIRNEGALQNVALNSSCKLKRGGGNVTWRQPCTALSHVPST